MLVCALALVALWAGATVVGVDSNKAIGTPSAPITIEIFSDFECPPCKQFHETTILPQLMRDYVIPGKVFVASFEFPLQAHPHSREAAGYAVAASRAGMYMPVADALFRAQQSWSMSGRVWDTVASVLDAAQQKRVQALARDPGVLAEIESEIAAGRRVPVTETPTLVVIRGPRRIPVPGRLIRYELLKRLLDDLGK